MTFEHTREIVESTPSRIVLYVIDGLGGLPHPRTGKSELETARISHLNALAAESVLGLTDPVAPGVTPGSGPGHLALFGYDPQRYLIKRGVMEALGIGIKLKPGEVAARGNFCTVDARGNVIDRRAGRIPTEESAPLCASLNQITVDGAGLSVHPVKDHRFVAIFSGGGLGDDVSESDPQKLGVPPLAIRALSAGSRKTARAAEQFSRKAREVLAGRDRANMALLRGFSKLPGVPSMGGQFKLNPAAIASYPMYRGLSRIVGMRVIATGATLKDELDTLAQHWSEHDYFYLHFKPADAAGEDGDFDGKVRALEEADAAIPRLRELKPDVLMVAGDHSTPSVLAGHSWHPVPFLLHSAWSGRDGVAQFSERACARGSLGRFPASHVMLLALANARKLAKFGA